VKAGWTTKPLGELCNIIGGGTPPKNRPDYYGGDIPWATVRDMRADIITSTEHSITSEAVKASATNIIPAGNIVIATRVGLGKVCLLTQDTAVNQDLRGIVPKSNKEIDVAFLFAWFKSISEQIIAEGTGSTVQGVKLPFIKGLSVPVPAIEEQRRIVTLLDEAFADIATSKVNAEKNLQNARELFTTQLQVVFGEPSKDWIKTTIEEHIRFIDYRGKTPIKTSQGLRLITAKNVKMGFIQKTPEEFVAPDSYDSWMTRGIPNKGDVLFTTEAPLANVAQLDTDEKVVFAQRIIIMQPNRQKLDPTFLKVLLLSPPIQQRIKDQGTGATVQGIKASLLKKIEISFPTDVNNQTSIVAQLESLSEEVDRLDAIYCQKLIALDDLKKSLLHQAFSGQL
jgi:type I restriction enzyme, S subunit